VAHPFAALFDAPVTVGHDVRARAGVRPWDDVEVVVQVQERRIALDLGQPALEQWCEDCSGTGRAHSAAWEGWDEEHARLSVQAVDAWREPILQDIVREQLADLAARTPAEPRVGPCAGCEGSGTSLTPFGHAVLDLVRRHLS
jgi:hypothetical protein